jgi:hypothetical protein
MESIRGRGAPASEVEADAIDLVRSRERYQPPPGQKQRVRARILEHRVDGGRGPSRRLLAVSIVAAAVIGVAGTSLALGGNWIARSYHAFAAGWHSHSDRPEPLAETTAGTTARAPLEPLAPAPLVEAPTPPEPLADAPPRAPSAPSHAARQPSEDDRLVFDAMRALRQENKPDRAARELDEYLRRHPQGELAEEALALSIEAALVRGDPRAKEMANRYLATYPKGRFRQVAERARARSSP